MNNVSIDVVCPYCECMNEDMHLNFRADTNKEAKMFCRQCDNPFIVERFVTTGYRSNKLIQNPIANRLPF